MRRRRFLCAMAAGSVLTAGCVGTDSEPGEGSSTGTESASSTTANAPPTTNTPNATESPSSTTEPEPATESRPTPPTDRAVRWRTGFERPVVGPVAVASETVYVAVGKQSANRGTPTESTTGATVAVLATTDGGERWRRSLSAPATDGPVVHEGGVYVVTGTNTGLAGRNQRLRKLSTDGTTEWHTDKVDQTLNLVAIGANSAYLGTNDDAIGTGGQRLFAVDTRTGRTRWSVESGDAFAGRLLDEALLVDFGGMAMAAYDPSDGSKRWQATGTGLGPGWDRIAVAGGVTFLGVRPETGNSGRFAAVELSDGSRRWSYTNDGGQAFVATGAAVSGGIVVGTEYDGLVFALDVADGTERWTVTADGETPGSSGSPVFVDGTVYVGDSRGTVYALATEDGTERWRANVDGWIDSLTPTDGGLVVAARARGKTPDTGHKRESIRALDADDGTERWVFAAAEGLTTPTVANGRTYIGSTAGVVRALGR